MDKQIVINNSRPLDKEIIVVCGNVCSGKTYFLDTLETKGYKVYREEVEKWGPLLYAIDKDPSYENIVKFYKTTTEYFVKVYKDIMFGSDKFIAIERDIYEHVFIFINSLKERYGIDEQIVDYVVNLYRTLEMLYSDLNYKVYYMDTPKSVIIERLKERNQVFDEKSQQFIDLYFDKYNMYRDIIAKDSKPSEFDNILICNRLYNIEDLL